MSTLRVSCKICFRDIMLFFFWLTILQTLTNGTSTSAGHAAGNATDHLALIAFKSKISNDPHGILKSWNDSIHFCFWAGITCSHRRNRVTILDLSSKDLVGSLSPSIGNLSFLREIKIPNNSFHGDIPPEIGRLFRLQLLSMSNNSFQGKLPSNLSHCSNLYVLCVGFNKLAGKLPVELASMSKLTNLCIHYNQFTGEIPPFIGNLTSLLSLSAAQNNFEGSIPDTLGRLRSLRYFALGGNNLSGKMPPSIFNISMVSIFSLADNKLEGNLPWDIGLTLPHIKRFQIWGNFISGQIPVTLSNASKLEWIEMLTNNFSGKVIVPFGRLKNLERLNLARNHLGSGEVDEMNFFTSLANCSSLRLLDLTSNQLKGKLPNSVANLSSRLMFLTLGANSLFGDLPIGFGNLGSLSALGLENNQFTGPIPADIGRLHKLQRIALGENKLSEKIPDSFGNLTLLNELYLEYNRLNGSIPSSLGNCQELLLLSLYHNDLSGTIPKELFSISMLTILLGLAHNYLVGSIPSEVGKLKNLEQLDASMNRLSGEIPSTLSSCTSLLNLYLESNHFQGSIPPSLSSLRGIEIIDFSTNNLTGKIPQFMESLSLEYLNLSFNNFEGEIPTKGIFRNASAISIEGNRKLCGGIAELGLPKCSIKATKKGKLSLGYIFILVISVICALAGVTIALFFLFCWSRRKNKEQTSRFLLGEPLKQLSYKSLLKATDGFSLTNLIGRGAFGSVYKGVLDEDGTNIAVKVLDLQHQGASKSFLMECEALRNVRHRNIVKIITCCSSIDFQGNDFKALVYEFMTNGSLEKWLHSSSQETDIGEIKVQNLNLAQRIGIAIDVASALDYLHNHCSKPIVHCDLKPSNVLLDNNMTAHVGDFGLAKIFSELRMPNQSSSIGVKGTIGYTAPEYGIGSEVTARGDVYSYGILVLEMMTGKRPTDSLFEEGLNIHNYARMALSNQVVEIVDLKLLQEAEATIVNHQNRVQAQNANTMDCLVSMIKIGVACSLESPLDRMGISAVISELHLIRNNLLQNQANHYHALRTGPNI